MVLDVRGNESEAYYTINEQPMVADVEGMQAEYKTPAQRWIVNTVSAGEEAEKTISNKRDVLNSIEEIKSHLESPP